MSHRTGVLIVRSLTLLSFAGAALADRTPLVSGTVVSVDATARPLTPKRDDMGYQKAVTAITVGKA